jgi:hypothetical protein
VGGVALSAAFCFVGLYRRRRQHRWITSAYTMELVFDSIQLGTVLVAGVYPIGYLLVSLSMKGGTVEQNLPPGVGQDFLLGVLVVGGAATLVYTVFNYLKHL